ncbi:MAG: TonB-dependent receptor [Gammaproteobacteria bacterium]|nr:TonB-dependent receptor [Gammaproteobacteria bacterium]
MNHNLTTRQFNISFAKITLSILLLLCIPFVSVNASAQENQGVLEEVIVTAQRRAESAQDVPIAMAAFTSSELKALSVTNLQELIAFVPGVELFDDRGAGMPVWVIRGVGLKDFNSNNAPTAAIYYDDFYLTSNVMGGIGMFDIEQIEILKGPQGGLYGRNTTGGAIRVNSVKPSTEMRSGYAKGTYGSWGRYGFEGAVGGPISDNVAYRVAGVFDQGGGWQDSLTTAKDDKHGDRDFYAIRAQLLFKPNENVDINVKLDFGEDNSETILGRAIGTQDMVYLEPPCQAILAGLRDDSTCGTWTNATLAFFTGDPGDLPDVQSANGDRILANPISHVNNDWLGLNLQLHWDIGYATFSSITGYIDYRNIQLTDFDASPFVFAHEDGDAQLEAWSQEFRLVSNSSGPFSWLVGMSYSEDTDEEFRIMSLMDNWIIASDIGGSGDRGFDQETESWAVYGQGAYDINDRWRLNGSLRYTDESKSLSDAFFYLPDFGIYLFEGIDKEYELDEPWSGHLGIDWRVADHAMLYAKMTRSYKSGGFFGGFAFDPGELDPYLEETIWAYELGFKADFLDNTFRLNGAVFFYDYSDAQGFVTKTQPSTGTDLVKLGNVGDAEHKGFELDAIWAPSSAPGLTFKAGVAYVDAEIVDSDQTMDTTEGITAPLEGLKRPGPNWSYALQGRYEFSLSGKLQGNIQLDYSWRDDYIRADMLPEGAKADLALSKRDGYGLLNARLGMGSIDGPWNVALVGKNLTDEIYTINAAGDSLGSYWDALGQPRSWALELTYTF